MGATLAAMVVFIVTISLLNQLGIGRTWPLVISEGVLVVVAALWFRFGLPERRSLRDMLGLRRPAAVFVTAAILIGCSQWIWNLAMASALADHLPPSPRTQEAMTSIVVQPHLFVSLFAIALMPALCEEIVFRGVLARGLASRFVPLVAILASATLFSLFHMSLAQAIPTLTLGLVYGLLAVRSRSAVPSFVAHFINNGMAVIASRQMLHDLFMIMVTRPVLAIGCALGVTLLGIALILRGGR